MPSRQALVQTEAQGKGGGEFRHSGSRKPCFFAPRNQLIMNRASSEHQQFFKLSPDSSSIYINLLKKGWRRSCKRKNLNNWNEVVSVVVFRGGFLGIVYWMVVHNTKSLLCKKQQNDRINIPFIALCYTSRKVKLSFVQITVSVVAMMQMSSFLTFICLLCPSRTSVKKQD